MGNGMNFTVRVTDAGQEPRSFERRRRNRHGRGLRGDLLPAHLPGFRSRAERFDDWVLESAERLQQLWGDPISAVQFVVEPIPPDLERLAESSMRAPLGQLRPARPHQPAVIAVYRHPVETEAGTPEELPEVIHDVVVEQAAELLGMPPEGVDPRYGRSRTQ
jgi:hypothetical protein